MIDVDNFLIFLDGISDLDKKERMTDILKKR